MSNDGQLQLPPEYNGQLYTDSVDIPAGRGRLYYPINWFGIKHALFPHAPNVLDIHQAAIGNCYLLAALQAIVERQPDTILNMLRDLRDGTVVVRLFRSQLNGQPAGTPIYIRIQKTRLASLNPFADPIKHDAPWVHMIEKAYAVLRRCIERTQYREPITKFHRPANDIVEALDSGRPEDSLKILLGADAVVGRHHIDKERFPEAIPNPKNRHELMAPLTQRATTPYLDIYNLFCHAPDPSNPHFTTSLNRIFPLPEYQETQHTIQANLTIEIAHNLYFALYNQQKQTGKTLRSDTLWQTLHYHTQDILSEQTLVRLHDYIINSGYFPLKRGTTAYTEHQFNYYQVIERALQANHILCLSTDTHIGAEKMLFSTRLNPVKGLVGRHVYHVINCYQRAGHCYIQIRNPWAWYKRGYVEKANGAWGAKGFKQVAQCPDSFLPRDEPARDFDEYHQNIQYAPGVFELELSDLLKRFSVIYQMRLPAEP